MADLGKVSAVLVVVEVEELRMRNLEVLGLWEIRVLGSGDAEKKKKNGG